MENDEYFEINEYAHRTAGILIETYSTIEMFMSITIANYFCKDPVKVDYLVGFIQEAAFANRISHLKMVLKETDRELLNKQYEFIYLEKDNIKVKTIVDAIEAFNSLRNKFAHSTIDPIEKRTGNELVFKLQKFKTITKGGSRIEQPMVDTLSSFSTKDFDALSSDVKILHNTMIEIFYRVKGD